MGREAGFVKRFFDENREAVDGKPKFETRRQASKYLMRFGRVWKAEHGIDLAAPKRGNVK